MYRQNMYAIQPLEGRRILRGVRVSTPHQVENWSVLAQERDFDEVLTAWGASIIPFDEQQISGRDLAKRKIFLAQMERLKRGEADGIAYYDVKRLTRNEFGIDGGIIAKQLIELRAILVTFRKIYELWREADLKEFMFECMLAGIDVRGIRDTFWRGLFARAESEPFQMGKAPVGYRNRREVYLKSNGREKTLTILEKDPDAREVMDEIIRLMNECHSLGEVCRQLNQVERFLMRARGKQRGERIVPWKPNNLARMLNNPKYHGQWYFGQNSKRTSPVWEGREDKRFHHEAPDLAYWTAGEALGWRKKFKPTGAWVPQSRARKYQHGLIGVLACVACGRPMVSAGALGYQCQTQRNGLCPAPQVLGERGALKALREILPDLLPSADDLAAENARQASTNDHIAEIEARLAMLQQQQQEDTAAWMSIRGAKPASITQALQDREQQIDATRARLEEARTELQATNGSFTDAQELLEHSQQKIDTLTPYQQSMVYRLLVKDVRIRGEGIARGRTWTVEPGYTALLKGSTLSDPIAAHWYTNLALALSA